MKKANIVNQECDTKSISKRSFIYSIIFIFILMVATYVLTFFIDKGTFVDGVYVRLADKQALPFYKFIFSPFLLLGGKDNTTIIGLIILLLIIGGVFICLQKSNIINCLLNLIIRKFKNHKYALLFILIAFFMFLGAFASIFEESVILIPIIIALAIKLGWDEFTGLLISLVSVTCGFACAIINPFTIGVAQSQAGLAIFSGIGLRLISLIIVYLFISLFTYFRAKRIDSHPSLDVVIETSNKDLEKGTKAFLISFIIGIVLVIVSSTIPFTQNYTIVIILLAFLISSIIGCVLAKYNKKDFCINFLKGMLEISPVILMLLMASSIKYMLEESSILGTILNSALSITTSLPPFMVLLFLFIFAYLVNFFIPSGSSEALLVIPLMLPIALGSNISSQTTCLAFIFGDGFSNILFPTVPLLLIALSYTKLNYFSYLKKSLPIHLALIAISVAILSLAFVINY